MRVAASLLLCLAAVAVISAYEVPHPKEMPAGALLHGDQMGIVLVDCASTIEALGRTRHQVDGDAWD